MRLLATALFGAALVASPALAVSPALPPATSLASALTGETLRDYCGASVDQPPAAACWIYVTGVSDGLLMALGPGDRPYCLPGELQAGQLTGAVRLYLADHPEGRQASAAEQVVSALKASFPCAAGARR